jgi:hypothetical protein
MASNAPFVERAGLFSGSPCRLIEREILVCWVLTWRPLGGLRGIPGSGSTRRFRGFGSDPRSFPLLVAEMRIVVVADDAEDVC